MVINGNEDSPKDIRLEGLQCILGECPQEEVNDGTIPSTSIPWSETSSWASGALPVEGEDVEIPADKWIELDLAETPILNLLTVNGRLSFKDNNGPVNLRAKQVYVRAGELLVGAEDAPFNEDAQITLYGLRNEATTIMSGSVETGNKLIVNTNLFEMHGLTRSHYGRLQASVFNGDVNAQVESGLGWQAGETLYFAPTNHQWTHSEYKTIVSYDDATGALVLDSAFDFYHFGAEASTEGSYNVDMRGEVRLLNRNVRVVGHDDGDQWGCNILSLDRVEFDGTARQATTKLDSVEVTQCSQENTFKAAIRFENTGETAASYVKNSVVHNSQAWSLYIANSKNILVENSDFIGSKAVGVNLKSITDVTVDGIFVADVVSRVNEAGDKFVDKEGCVTFCSYFEPDTGCSGSKVINSIAAGCPYTGFIAPGHACDDYSSEKFRNNVAHSGERTGGHIYPDPSDPTSSQCYEGSYFKAYKNRDGGLTTMYNTFDQRMRYMTFVDNEKGITLQSSGERDELYISMRDIDFYGESATDNLDAPAG